MKPVKKTININAEIEAYNYICRRAEHELIRKIEEPPWHIPVWPVSGLTHIMLIDKLK